MGEKAEPVTRKPDPEFIKLFSCSAGMKFIMLISVKMSTDIGILTLNATYEYFKAKQVFIFLYFSFYEHFKFYALMS